MLKLEKYRQKNFLVPAKIRVSRGTPLKKKVEEQKIYQKKICIFSGAPCASGPFGYIKLTIFKKNDHFCKNLPQPGEAKTLKNLCQIFFIFITHSINFYTQKIKK